MATYEEISQWLRETHGVRGIKTFHIAHAKKLSGLPVRKAWNRRTEGRVYPCPPDKLPYIQEALRHFRML